MTALQTFYDSLNASITEEQAIEAYSFFLRDLATELDYFTNPQPQEAKNTDTKARKQLKKHFPLIEKLPKNWLNARGLRDESGELLPLEERVQALKQALKENDPEFFEITFGNALEDKLHQLQAENESLKQDILALELEVARLEDLNKPIPDSVQEMNNQQLLGSKKPGAGEELARRAVQAIMEHNETTQDIDLRYQISISALVALTGVGTAKAQKILGKHDCLGEMTNEVKAHYQKLDPANETGIATNPTFNRGKPPITEVITGFKA